MGENNANFITKFTTDEHGNPIFEIPEELLQALAWKEGDEIETQVFFDRVILRKVL
jgi:antitoxin component of MazEF toxin-antitoxin module